MPGIVNILISAIAIFIAAYLLPGVNVQDFLVALIVAVVLAILNSLVKPILIILTLPITIITLGLFTFILNGLLVLLTSKIVSGFSVDNLWWAILFSFVVSLINSVLHHVSK